MHKLFLPFFLLLSIVHLQSSCNPKKTKLASILPTCDFQNGDYTLLVDIADNDSTCWYTNNVDTIASIQKAFVMDTTGQSDRYNEYSVIQNNTITQGHDFNYNDYSNSNYYITLLHKDSVVYSFKADGTMIYKAINNKQHNDYYLGRLDDIHAFEKIGKQLQEGVKKYHQISYYQGYKKYLKEMNRTADYVYTRETEASYIRDKNYRADGKITVKYPSTITTSNSGTSGNDIDQDESKKIKIEKELFSRLKKEKNTDDYLRVIYESNYWTNDSTHRLEVYTTEYFATHNPTITKYKEEDFDVIPFEFYTYWKK